jgi:YVTN family beta-propeller protein
MKKNFAAYLLVAVSVMFMVSCEPNNDSPEVKVDAVSGVFITNEGSFQKNNGSVSYYNLATENIIVDPFQITNGVSAGDVVQSFAVVNDSLGLVVANYSNAVKLVNLSDFKLKGTCPITYPRYALQVAPNKVYVTQGSFAGKVMVLNTSTMKVEDSIAVKNGPEHLVKSGNYVFVANSGGWGQDSVVSVIDLTTNKVTKNIVAGQNPIDLTVDADGNIWVLCEGSYEYAATLISGQSTLVKIDVKSLTVTESVKFGTAKDSFLPIHLSIGTDKRTLYFVEKDGVYTYNTSSKTLSKTPFLKGLFNGMDVNPSNGDIYAFVVTAFSAPGTMYVYDSKGVEKTRKIVGIMPNGAVFK